MTLKEIFSQKPLPRQGSLAGDVSRPPANLAGYLCVGANCIRPYTDTVK